MTDEDIELVFQNLWNELGDDVSTEYLLQMTSEKTGLSYYGVVAALRRISEKGNKP